MKDIRPSLHHGTYIEHARTIKLAADENNRAFYELINKAPTEENRLKGLGLFRASLLLYAISIELTLKAVGLYEERENIQSGKIETFNDFLKKMRRTGHEFIPIVDRYRIDLDKEERAIISHLQDYAVWAGRFPFPKNDDDTRKIESIEGAHGPSLTLEYVDRINKIIEKQVKRMNSN